MAKIEMDISEYESMKEYKKLLEQSLEHEKELSSKIILLEQEKNKVLEDSKMKVIKTVKNETTEHILYRKDIREVVAIILNAVGAKNPYNAIDMHGLGYLEQLFDNCFSKSTSYSNGDSVTYTTVGLDEIKQELKSEIQLSIDNETQQKIKNYDLVVSEKDNLVKKIDGLKDEIYLLTKNNDILKSENKSLHKDLYILESNVVNLKNNEDVIRIINSNKFTLFNSFSKINKIKKLLIKN